MKPWAPFVVQRRGLEHRVVTGDAVYRAVPRPSTPPSAPIHLRVLPEHAQPISCERGLGKLSSAACQDRWRTANLPIGRRRIERGALHGLRISACRACPHGAERCGKPAPKPRDTKRFLEVGTCRGCGDECAKARALCDECIARGMALGDDGQPRRAAQPMARGRAGV